MMMPTDINWSAELLGALIWLQILATLWVFGLVENWKHDDAEDDE